GTALFLWPRDRITAESWDKIRLGMREKEEEGILGGPGRNYDEYLDHLKGLDKNGKRPIFDGIILSEPTGGWLVVSGDNTKYWIGNRGCMEIRFDPQGHVTTRFFQGYRSADPTFFDRLRGWLGW